LLSSTKESTLTLLEEFSRCLILLPKAIKIPLFVNNSNRGQPNNMYRGPYSSRKTTQQTKMQNIIQLKGIHGRRLISSFMKKNNILVNLKRYFTMNTLILINNK